MNIESINHLKISQYHVKTYALKKTVAFSFPAYKIPTYGFSTPLAHSSVYPKIFSFNSEIFQQCNNCPSNPMPSSIHIQYLLTEI